MYFFLELFQSLKEWYVLMMSCVFGLWDFNTSGSHCYKLEVWEVSYPPWFELIWDVKGPDSFDVSSFFYKYSLQWNLYSSIELHPLDIDTCMCVWGGFLEAMFLWGEPLKLQGVFETPQHRGAESRRNPPDPSGTESKALALFCNTGPDTKHAGKNL